jgi:CRP/FNR family transcriptional regulator, cyclic AMP receptor protein
MSDQRDMYPADGAVTDGDALIGGEPGELDPGVSEDSNQGLLNQVEFARRRTHALRGQAERLKAASTGAESSLRRRAWTDQDGDQAGAHYAYVLREDPDLAQALSATDRERLTHLLQAPVVSLRDKSWHPPDGDHDRMYGVLVLDGLLGRRLQLGEAASIELLGRGDIIRPWQHPPETAIPAQVDWRVLSPVRLALLDERITAWIGLRRELTVAFAARLVRRANAAAYLAAIGHVKRVEERLLAMLWHLGSNWGQVTPHGVRIPFRLTHAVLGELVGAHRPSVTIGLRKLRERGQLGQTDDGRYLLTGAPPDWSRGA